MTDADVLLLALTTLLGTIAVLGLLASAYGVDSRDGFGDPDLRDTGLR